MITKRIIELTEQLVTECDRMGDDSEIAATLGYISTTIVDRYDINFKYHTESAAEKQLRLMWIDYNKRIGVIT